MSTAPELTGDELLAAELAIGLLEGEALAAARRREAEEPEFAALVAAWAERLAPLLEEVRDEAPPPTVWNSIEARIGPAAAAAADTPSNVHQLRRRTSLWRGYSLAVTALAASLVLALVLRDGRRDPDLAPIGAPSVPRSLVATLSTDDGPAAMVAAYSPDTRSMIVAPAAMQPADGHDHQLWLLVPGAAPRSLGLVRAAAGAQRLMVPDDLAPALAAQMSLALSVEPVGGSPTGQPTGPVIASGELRTV
jgi:anti-sigma-K factor RskA